MRIFIASGIFHPEVGGPATHLHALLPQLRRRRHDVTAVAFGDGPSVGYPYSLVRVPRSGGYLRRQVRYLRSVARLWPGHDVAYVHSLGLAIPPGVRPRVGRIVSDQAWERAVNRGWIPPEIGAGARRGLRLLDAVNKALYHREARRLDAVIVPSDYVRRGVIRWGIDPAKVTVVYNAIDGDMALPTETKSEARRRLNLPNVPLLLTAARLTPFRGVDHTIRAIARLPDVHLLVAGDGTVRPALEALARDLGVAHRVQFFGFVAREQLPPLYRAADYTVLCSAVEGLPHVLLESLRCGTPVIASDRGGNPEVVRPGRNGWLVPYADEDALAATLERALAPGEAERCAANAGLGLERFSWERLVEQTTRVLARACGAP